MNNSLAQYLIACIHNADSLPTPESIQSYLIEPLDGVKSTPVMHYKMLDVLVEAIDENRAVDAFNIFNLIWWDMTDSTAQRIFNLVKDMECDPDDDLAFHLSHTILGKFYLLT